jgi:nucleotide-binding universal stress UspA family protein
MLATDGSDAARAAEAWVSSGGWQPNTLVDIVCVARRSRPRSGWSLQTYRQPVRVAVDGLVEAQQLAAQSIANESGRRIQAAGLEVRTWARAGDPAQELIEMAHRERPDLLVIGPRGRRGWAAVFLGSVSDEVLAHVTVPVFLARQLTSGRATAPRELAVIVDAGCLEGGALRWVGRSGWHHTARVTIVSVAHPMPDGLNSAEAAQASGDATAVSALIASHVEGAVVRYVSVDRTSTAAILDAVSSLGVDVLVLAQSRRKSCVIAAVDIAINATIPTVILPSIWDEGGSVADSPEPDRLPLATG